jgi:CelD/BcsL family acetyltransferase involved in cellulose biosynthesis
MSVVTELSELPEIEGDWRRLAESRGNAFLTPEWFRCWFEHYGEEGSPFIPIVRDAGGGLKGLLPLVLARSGHPRVCRIVGGNIGDRFHPVSRPEDEEEVAAAAGEALGSAALPWSILALDHVEVDTPWVDALARSTGARLRSLKRRPDTLPMIDLSAHSSWDAYLASRSSNLRQQVRRFRRRAAKGHSLRLRRTEHVGQLASDMERFFHLHDLRRELQGGSSLSTDRARSFHLRFAASCLERGWLRLWFLELDERPIAAWYGWRLGARYSYYNSGFDPSWSALRPGLLLLAGVIESALEEGAAEFDFLLGEEHYKLRFAEGNAIVRDVLLARGLPHPAAMVASAEHGLRRTGRLLPAGARQRLGRARRSLLWGRGR